DQLDHVETRGRKPKERVPGTVTIKVDLTPASLEALDKVKDISRSVGWAVGSRSEIINEALAGHPGRYLVLVKSSLEECRDLLPKRARAAMEDLTADLPDLLTLKMTAATREALAKIDRAYRKAEVNGGRAGLITRLLLDVAAVIP